MIKLSPLARWPRTLSTRRLVLLATVANLGVAALVIGPAGSPQSLLPAFSTAAAETVQPPGDGILDAGGKKVGTPVGKKRARITVECANGRSYSIGTGTNHGWCEPARDGRTVIGGVCRDNRGNEAYVSCDGGCARTTGGGSCARL